eukprot:4795819-Pleurochrysis_carterae.AAC.3
MKSSTAKSGRCLSVHIRAGASCIKWPDSRDTYPTSSGESAAGDQRRAVDASLLPQGLLVVPVLAPPDDAHVRTKLREAVRRNRVDAQFAVAPQNLLLILVLLVAKGLPLRRALSPHFASHDANASSIHQIGRSEGVRTVFTCC